MPTRALIVVRLSRLTDASTSPERQAEACRRVCQDRSWEVVGVAEDLDVSAGTTSPFDRPSLKTWLDEPSGFDVIVFYRLDRLVRRAVHLWRVIEYADEHRLNLVSATEPFDLSTSLGKMLASLIASVAEMEIDAISERNASAYQHNRTQGKWTGGVPFMGYLPQRDEHGDWRYAHDPVLAPVVQEVARRIVDGHTIRSIVNDLNDRGVPTVRDRFREFQGEEPKGFRYSISSLQRSMRSAALLGYSVVRDLLTDENGKPVKTNGRKQYGPEYTLRAEDGTPVVRGPALIDRLTFDQLQKQLDARQYTGNFTVRSTALLLRVIYCAVCGNPMYTLKGRTRLYYRCAAANYRQPCSNKMIRQDEADQTMTDIILGLFGESERLERVWNPGEDHSRELAEIDAELTDLTGQLGTAAFRPGTPQRKRLDERINALSERQEELSALPATESEYRYLPVGETFREAWERMNTEERNMYMRDHSVSVKVDQRPNRPGDRLAFEFGELYRMLEHLQAEGTAANNVRKIMEQHG